MDHLLTSWEIPEWDNVTKNIYDDDDDDDDDDEDDDDDI